VVAVGNIHGQGERLLEHFEHHSATLVDAGSLTP
jgi:hypothetical protein